MVNRPNGRMMQRGVCPNMSDRRRAACVEKNNAPSCGCERSDHEKDCKVMMQRLKAVEFAMYDIMLYLDVYPECSEALSYYSKLSEEREVLRTALAKKCRRPVTACENAGEDAWDWIASPWPWDPSAN